MRISLKIVLPAAAVASFLVVAACVHFCRNRWIEVPLEAVLTVCFVPPAVVLTPIALLLGRRRPWLHEIGVVGLGVLVFVGVFWVGAPLRMFLANHDQKKAREFCAFLLPTLERYRAEHEEYPPDIISMVLEQASGKPPKLIENGFQYRRHNGSYTLAYIDPQQPFAWHVYDSQKDAWSLEAD